MKRIIMLFTLLAFSISAFGNERVKGRVYGKESNSKQRPLPGANIIFAGTSNGTTSDASGNFELAVSKESNTLIVSYVGFVTDTIQILDQDFLEVVLRSSSTTVKDVEVVGTQSSLVLDYKGIENSQVITKRELQKAACCDLSESFETNPSVDVSVTDAITGIKQIEMLGLSGIYTQKSLEAIPYLRGLSSNIGLTFLPGTWIKSINVNKGIGSVVNGFESMTGQIDVGMVKPFDPLEKDLTFNAYGNLDQRFEGNLNYRKNFGDYLSSITLLHVSSRQHESDVNNDNFMDLPRYNDFNILQKWKLIGEDNWETQIGIQYYQGKKDGGTLASVNTSSHNNTYRYNSDNQNIRVYGKLGYVFPNSDYKSIGFQWAFNRFENESGFGTRNYTGIHNNVFLNLIYQSSIFNDSHKFRTGLSFLFDEFEEEYINTDYNRIERIPGAYFEYTFSPDETFSVVAGTRLDEHNFFGTMFTPRLHMRYASDEDWVFRATGGKGYRSPNIFMEYSSIFVSSRELQINSANSFGYGLQQEEAWNFGLNITHYFLYEWREATISIDFYRTEFVNALIADIDTDQNKIIFYDESNGITSNSFQTELNIEPFERVETRAAYRYLDVQQKINSVWKSKPLTSKHRALFNLGYRTEEYDDGNGWAFDVTYKWFGTKRVPSVSFTDNSRPRRTSSPYFSLVNTQVTKRFELGFDLYLGIENVFNFRQDEPIVDPQNPNGDTFDASLVWGPVSGRMAYLGLRYEL